VTAAVVNSGWTLDPGPVVRMLGAGGHSARRSRAARAAANAHANHQAVLYARRHEAPTWRAVCFAAALLAAFAALVSPIDQLGESVLTMHMLQHLLLLDVAPILGILAMTRVILRPATRRLMEVERAAGPLGHPVFAAFFYIATMAFWHIPAMYDAALRHAGVHALEHIMFTVAGGLYWWHLLSPIRNRHRLSNMGPVIYMVATKIGVGLIGIAITFAPHALYAFYKTRGPVWGMSPSTDQELAGALMAVEQSVVMGSALAWLFIRMLGESQRTDERSERYEPV
jgi:cytochrome c oxidase assembly factor CtaG